MLPVDNPNNGATLKMPSVVHCVRVIRSAIASREAVGKAHAVLRRQGNSAAPPSAMIVHSTALRSLKIYASRARDLRPDISGTPIRRINRAAGSGTIDTVVSPVVTTLPSELP